MVTGYIDGSLRSYKIEIDYLFTWWERALSFLKEDSNATYFRDEMELVDRGLPHKLYVIL